MIVPGGLGHMVWSHRLARMTASFSLPCGTSSLQPVNRPAEGSCLWWECLAARSAVEPRGLLYTASPHDAICGKCRLSRTAARLLPQSSAPHPPSHEMHDIPKNGMPEIAGKMYVAVAECRL